ncbi:sodium-translocating pyrophosphatase [Holospora curviuscula]|uniref:K(+)-insensitive pyrophosphate-energized proton pump n=1 Tax=Holospora curviuscula TaxID=1082868 RepID=A0A2S5R880_9PROT|nr:sodium-translocating pyrophosphatase [Holospora curviuscula]PPE03534.1 K(+)-insensitive pyrophosphate-energized proton pump [Holospora curviuscula]
MNTEYIGLGLAWASGIIALLYSATIAKKILSLSSGTLEMQRIAQAIQEGAQAYLKRQFLTISFVGVILAVMLYGSLGSHVSLGFILGAILSGVSGYAGMSVSVRANVRTTEAARSGLAQGLAVAFQAGAITGFLVVGLGLLGVVSIFTFLTIMEGTERFLLETLIAFGFGASLISIFSRVAGGIFTKGADVGADLVGKIEQGIPEDDPRNPAVIADNVGDNVGDCAGMSADIFETYVVTLVAALQIAFLTVNTSRELMIYPMVVSGVCMLGCILGTFSVRLGKKKNVMNALYKGLGTSIVLSIVGLVYVTWMFFGFDQILYDKVTGLSLVLSGTVGMVSTAILVWITEFYTSTSHRPVQQIARASVTGAATNVICGLAVSMEACFFPAVVVCSGILCAYTCAGLFGIALAGSSMLALGGIIIAIDAYGPVTDNAGGIAEMAGLPPEVREVTDALDAVGNTTKAVTKGYAIGSAALASLILFSAYTQELKHFFPNLSIDFSLNNPFLMTGLFLGGAVPYVFSSMSMKAVGKAGAAIVVEVRRQFSEIRGIMDGSQTPEYGKAVDILTKFSLKAMILPSLLPVVLPLGVYSVIASGFGQIQAFSALGGVLMGTMITGLFLAISMTSGGGAWDNAKKYIEAGHFGGKGSSAHQAAVVGDTVGDPYKDTAGPALNPFIKIVNLVALMLLAFL